jgi:DNA mismatch repair ATPase MutS
MVELLDSGRNQMFAAPAFYMLWLPQFSWRIEMWRRRNGAALGRWIDAVAELEALSSLSGFAYEHPSAVFPTLLGEGSRFESKGLAHPLIAESKAVDNDLRFGAELRLLLISGSNMSGKSTLLRAVGLNTILAWAGAPVRARSLTLSPFALGASIRATDSLLEGRSRFYAEILRLKQIQKLTAGDRPALFLLDELLSGTNSHDRAVGADNYLNGLVARGAVGLATTHDLALTQVADRMGARAANVNLADTIKDGEVLFDYKLRPGVVQRGNALALMRAVGLEVNEQPEDGAE